MKVKLLVVAALTLLIIGVGIIVIKPRALPRPPTWYEHPELTWDLTNIKPWEVQEEQIGPALTIRGSEHRAAGKRVVILRRGSLTQSLVVHFPYGEYEKGSQACVLVPSGGGNLITGTVPSANREIMKPYLSRGFVVISYELSGAIAPGDARDPEKLSAAYRKFVSVKAGLVNSRNALEYAVQYLKIVDPQKIFVAGYSSGGTQALLFAAHEQRLAGCVAYCPDTGLSDFDARKLKSLKFLSGIDAFVTKAAPLTHVERIECPVMIFAVQDDEIVSFGDVMVFFQSLEETNKDAMLRWSEYGGHAIPYQTTGREQGAQWIERIAERD